MSAPVSLTSASNSSQSPTALGQAQLNMQDFIQLLTVQLENQDPMNPMSDTDFFAQMAQLGQVEGIDQLNNSAQVQQAQSLMGQTVTATNTNAATTGGPAVITGTVKALSIQNGAYYLGIQSSDGSMNTVPMSALQNVQQTPDVAGYAGMIGQTVTGTTTAVNGQSTTVTGTVTNVALVNGVPSVTVKPKTGNPVTIGINQLTSVS